MAGGPIQKASRLASTNACVAGNGSLGTGMRFVSRMRESQRCQIITWLMDTSDPEDAARLLASVLSNGLERELLKIERGHSLRAVKDVYDTVYLPKLIALIQYGNGCGNSRDWQLLREPLHPDLAVAQLRFVLELLHSTDRSTSPRGF
jgi:hypothetical protein